MVARRKRKLSGKGQSGRGREYREKSLEQHGLVCYSLLKEEFSVFNKSGGKENQGRIKHALYLPCDLRLICSKMPQHHSEAIEILRILFLEAFSFHCAAPLILKQVAAAYHQMRARMECTRFEEHGIRRAIPKKLCAKSCEPLRGVCWIPKNVPKAEGPLVDLSHRYEVGEKLRGASFLGTESKQELSIISLKLIEKSTRRMVHRRSERANDMEGQKCRPEAESPGVDSIWTSIQLAKTQLLWGNFCAGGMSLSEASWDSVVAKRSCVAAAEVLKSEKLTVCARRAGTRTNSARPPIQTAERIT